MSISIKTMDSIMPDKHTLSDLDKIAPPMLVKAFLFYNPPPDLSRLIESLQEGLKNAVHHLPFLAGDVQVDKDSGNGKPCIVMPSGGQGLELGVRYFSDDEHKPFSELEGDSFPADLEYTRLLPESLLPPPLGDGIKPVCAIQLNVLGDGGLVLGFTMHHSVGDWTSLAEVLGLVCRGSKAWYSGGEMPGYQANLDKGAFNGLAGLPQGELLKSCPGYYILDCTVPPAPKQQHPPYQASIYRITESTIKQLKQHCSSTLPDDVQYVTSYDCISAVLWTSITRARLRRYPEKASARSIFMHPVNLRTRDPEQETSLEYFGNACLPAQAGPVDAQLLGCATNESVSTAASCIRRSINNISLPSVKPLAALIRTLSPSELLGYHMNFHDMDMLMNSWYSGKAEDYEIGGPGGVPRAFRTQRPITGACCLVLPDFGGSGGTKVFDVFVQLEEGLQEALQEDSEFVRYFRVVA